MRSSKIYILGQTEHLYGYFQNAIAGASGEKCTEAPAPAIIRAVWEGYAPRITNSYLPVRVFGLILLADLITEGGDGFDLEGNKSMSSALLSGNTPLRPRFSLGGRLTNHLPYLAAECATSMLYITNGLFERMDHDFSARDIIFSDGTADLISSTEATYMGYLREHGYMLRVPKRKWPFFRRDWIL